MVYIYCLINPLNKKPFYVGASREPEVRLCAHHSELQEGINYNYLNKKTALIKKILSKGKRAKLVVLKSCKPKHASKWERHFYNLLSKESELLQSPHHFGYSKRYNN